MEHFRILVSDDIKEHEFNAKALGNKWYEITNDQGELMGSIKIDEKNHDHCETRECQLDLPLIASIRRNIFLHKILTMDWY